MKTFMQIFLTALLVVGTAIAQSEEQPQFTEEVDVNLVLIDAIVTNADGEQILGLDKDDFVVEEDGVKQEIESVDYYTNRRLVTGPEEEAEFEVEHIEEPRYFVFFFDKFAGQAPIREFEQELWRAVRAAKDFVENELLGEDYVAVLGHDARLEVYTDFTRDRDRIVQALEDARRFGDGNFEPSSEGPSLVEHLDETAMRNRTGWIWDALEVTGNALQGVQGRKVMTFFSPGFTGRNSTTPILEDRYYEPMIQALNEANTSVYAISLLPNIQAPALEANLTRLVEDTGGDYYPYAVNYKVPLRRIENRNNGYYMITYRSTKPQDQHGYQEVDVSVKNEEFRVEAREGYVY